MLQNTINTYYEWQLAIELVHDNKINALHFDCSRAFNKVPTKGCITNYYNMVFSSTAELDYWLSQGQISKSGCWRSYLSPLSGVPQGAFLAPLALTVSYVIGCYAPLYNLWLRVSMILILHHWLSQKLNFILMINCRINRAISVQYDDKIFPVDIKISY